MARITIFIKIYLSLFLVQCPAGSFSEQGAECQSCPKGQFAHKEGSSGCLECDKSKTTKDEGSVSKRQCENMKGMLF